MKTLLLIIGIIACLVLIIVIIGYTLPVKHQATVRVLVRATPEKVWQRLINIRDYPKWRTDLQQVVVVNDLEWTEIKSKHDQLPFKMVLDQPLQQLTMHINATNLPYGGYWVYTLTPQGDQTEVTITEHGEVYNPVFRFVSRFIMGHDATLKKYAHNLEQSFQ